MEGEGGGSVLDGGVDDEEPCCGGDCEEGEDECGEEDGAGGAGGLGVFFYPVCACVLPEACVDGAKDEGDGFAAFLWGGERMELFPVHSFRRSVMR